MMEWTELDTRPELVDGPTRSGKLRFFLGARARRIRWERRVECLQARLKHCVTTTYPCLPQYCRELPPPASCHGCSDGTVKSLNLFLTEDPLNHAPVCLLVPLRLPHTNCLASLSPVLSDDFEGRILFSRSHRGLAALLARRMMASPRPQPHQLYPLWSLAAAPHPALLLTLLIRTLSPTWRLSSVMQAYTPGPHYSTARARSSGPHLGYPRLRAV